MNFLLATVKRTLICPTGLIQTEVNYFFAKRVILVEGQTEKTIIPLLAKKIGVFRYDYTLVDCGSKENIYLYCQLLNKFCIPYVAVYDKDHQAHKTPSAIDVANRSNTLIENTIDGSIGSSISFVNDVEEELGINTGGDRNKPYAALTHVSSPGFTISANLESIIRTLYQ